MRYLKKFESSEWASDLLDNKLQTLAEFDDGYFKMVLKDIDYKDDNMILKVDFFEVNNKEYNGYGEFKYIESDIPGLNGDIIPIKMDGILEDVYYSDDEEVIFEFLQRIIDKISY